MISNQEQYDRVVNHLREQGCKSYHPDQPGRCMYRGDRGRKCAAGVLIPDDLYNPMMEGHGIEQLVRIGLPLAEYFTKEGIDIKLLKELQYIHDECPVEEWEEAFKGLAGEFNLQYRGI